MYSNQTSEFRCFFAIKCRFGHAQWSWPRNELVANDVDVISGTSQRFAFLRQLQFVCFLSRKTPHHYWNNSYLNYSGWTRRISWYLTWRHDHSETQTLFCTDSWSTSLGVAETGTLKLDLRTFKSQNPIFFFLEYLFTHYRATISIKTQEPEKPCWP